MQALREFWGQFPRRPPQWLARRQRPGALPAPTAEGRGDRHNHPDRRAVGEVLVRPPPHPCAARPQRGRPARQRRLRPDDHSGGLLVARRPRRDLARRPRLAQRRHRRARPRLAGCAEEFCRRDLSPAGTAVQDRRPDRGSRESAAWSRGSISAPRYCVPRRGCAYWCRTIPSSPRSSPTAAPTIRARSRSRSPTPRVDFADIDRLVTAALAEFPAIVPVPAPRVTIQKATEEHATIGPRILAARGGGGPLHRAGETPGRVPRRDDHRHRRRRDQGRCPHERMAPRRRAAPNRDLWRHVRSGSPRPSRRRVGGAGRPRSRSSRLHARRAAAPQARSGDHRRRGSAADARTGDRRAGAFRPLRPRSRARSPLVYRRSAGPLARPVGGGARTLLRDGGRLVARLPALARPRADRRPRPTGRRHPDRTWPSISMLSPAPSPASPGVSTRSRSRSSISPRTICGRASPPSARSPTRCRNRSSGISASGACIGS